MNVWGEKQDRRSVGNISATEEGDQTRWGHMAIKGIHNSANSANLHGSQQEEYMKKSKSCPKMDPKNTPLIPHAAF